MKGQDASEIKEFDACDANNKCWFEKSVGLKIIKKMGYEGKGLGKHEQGMREPIQLVVRPKNEGLGYGERDENNVTSVTCSCKSPKSMEFKECSHCHRGGHKKKEMLGSSSLHNLWVEESFRKIMLE